jgi:hypothetical protein
MPAPFVVFQIAYQRICLWYSPSIVELLLLRVRDRLCSRGAVTSRADAMRSCPVYATTSMLRLAAVNWIDPGDIKMLLLSRVAVPSSPKSLEVYAQVRRALQGGDATMRISRYMHSARNSCRWPSAWSPKVLLPRANSSARNVLWRKGTWAERICKRGSRDPWQHACLCDCSQLLRSPPFYVFRIAVDWICAGAAHM